MLGQKIEISFHNFLCIYKTVSSFVRLDDIFITGILAEKAGVSDFQSIFIPSMAFFIFQKNRSVENIYLRSMIMTKATAICTGMKIPSGKINSRSYSLSRDASMMLHHNTLASHISSVRKSTMHLHCHLQLQNDAFAYFCWY